MNRAHCVVSSNCEIKMDVGGIRSNGRVKLVHKSRVAHPVSQREKMLFWVILTDEFSIGTASMLKNLAVLVHMDRAEGYFSKIHTVDDDKSAFLICTGLLLRRERGAGSREFWGG